MFIGKERLNAVVQKKSIDIYNAQIRQERCKSYLPKEWTPPRPQPQRERIQKTGACTTCT